jgi:hypothetical protein
MEATRTSPMSNKEGQKLTRRFLGNINGKTPIEQKELRSYIKGRDYFTYGRDSANKPIYHQVRQNYFYQ